MKKRVSHVLKRPGLKNGDPSIEIPVAEDLVTTPGIRQSKKDVDFYSQVVSAGEPEHHQHGGFGMGVDGVSRRRSRRDTGSTCAFPRRW